MIKLRHRKIAIYELNRGNDKSKDNWNFIEICNLTEVVLFGVIHFYLTSYKKNYDKIEVIFDVTGSDSEKIINNAYTVYDYLVDRLNVGHFLPSKNACINGIFYRVNL